MVKFNIKRIRQFSLLSAILFFTACCTVLKHSNDEGFSNLFNGENFDGWYLKIRSGDTLLARNVYAIEDKMIHVFNNEFPDEYELNTGKNDTHGLFYTKKKYSKFILKFEYKWGKKIANNFDEFQYDAGCYYHVYDDAVWPRGIEYQVRYNHLNNKNHTGDFWASGTSLQWYSCNGESFCLPKDGGEKQPIRDGEHLAMSETPFNALNDQWNQCEVIVMDDKYAIHKLNGKIVNMATDLSVGEGIIGFQSETAEIYYKNILIKEFEDFVPIEKFLD